MNWRSIPWGCLAAILLSQVALAQDAPRAKNIVILVSDGGGFNAFKAASLYQYGREGLQPYEQEGWLQLASNTYPQDQVGSGTSGYGGPGRAAAPAPASYWDVRMERGDALSGDVRFRGYSALTRLPTDSAASATAMAAGIKTLNGRINYAGSGIGAGPLTSKTIAEIAKSLGKSAGVVTSVHWSDATPAAFGAARSSGRGERREIATQMLNNDTLDLIMGAGHPEFDSNGAPREAGEGDYDAVGGPFLWELLRSGRHRGGWTFIQSKAQFEALMSGPAPRRVFGAAPVAGSLQRDRQTRDWNGDGRVDAADARVAPPFGDPFNTTVPTLVTMTRAALNVLNQNPNGFFLMVEGGAVDHAGHANQPGRIIEEQIDFNHSVQAVVDWVNRQSSWDQTLVIVTADHETGMLFGINSDTVAFQPLINRGPGRAAGMWFNSGGHSSSLVPLKARGAGAQGFNRFVDGQDPVYGPYVDNTSIFHVMEAAFAGRLPSRPAEVGGYVTAPRGSRGGRSMTDEQGVYELQDGLENAAQMGE
jgi:alkaline phosphatase